jgi:hypothetical protein
MNAFKPESGTAPPNKDIHKESKEQEHEFPCISPKDRSQIERSSGEYRGYVQTDRGRMFEEVWTDRRARYSEEHAGVTEVFVETCGTNSRGEFEVSSADALRGFEVMVVEFSSSGHELAGPHFFKLHPKNFPGKSMSLDALRSVAREVHALLARKAREAARSELYVHAEAFLEERGWNEGT